MIRGWLLNKDVVIYTLTNPINGNVFYVGRTTQFLEWRLNGHVWGSQCQMSNNIYNYIKKLKRKKVRPVIEALETVSYADSNQAEGYWIQQMNAWGFNLMNIRLRIKVKGTKVKGINESKVLKYKRAS